MTSYIPRRSNFNTGNGLSLKSPISIDEGSRLNHIQNTSIPIIGLIESKRGSKIKTDFNK